MKKLSCVLGTVTCLAAQMFVWAAPVAAYTVAGCSTVAGPPVIGQQRSNRDESTDGRPATCSVAFNGANGLGESSSSPGVLRNAASTSFVAGSYASARARGEWRDQVTIVGPTFLVVDRPGRIYFDWGVEGRLETTGDATAAVFARLMAGPPNQLSQILGQTSQQLSTPGFRSVEAGGRGVELFFVFGQPFEVFFEVDVTARSPNNFPVNGSLIGGSASASFGSTAWWGGISRVEDEFGNALDIQVITDGGLNLMSSLKPASPVPEPATWVLMLMGMAIVLGWARHPRRRVGPA
ncbi:MAG: PEP-CTERM sorting domain-containing protein [Gammaproteobacteria bacterium]|nr:PEP-CTERM sorting domain-containing protein [Gammaproteobacteria bacterium]